MALLINNLLKPVIQQTIAHRSVRKRLHYIVGRWLRMILYVFFSLADDIIRWI